MTERRLGKDREMPISEKDLLAAVAMDRWKDFQESLSSEKRKYPIQQFRAFWSAATRYAELTKSDSLIHKSLAAAVNGLVEFLGAERKRVPGDILRDAERLECLLFRGYDPSFVGQQFQTDPLPTLGTRGSTTTCHQVAMASGVREALHKSTILAFIE